MLSYPDINPALIDFGVHDLPIVGTVNPQIHWYGLMYLFGFLAAWWLCNHRAKQKDSGWNNEQVSDVIFYGAMGVILGGRVGYVIFYKFEELLGDPLMIIRIWDGGMSFHGGMLGVALALFLFARKTNKTFFQVSDFVIPMVPLGLGFGRIGNFINKELPGRPVESSISWAFDYGDKIARHPSSLYQAFSEGLVLFIILFFYSRKSKPQMAVSGLFLMCYGVFRFITEFYRTPDDHLGFVMFDWMTKGQQLSIPMVIFGLVIFILAYKRQEIK